jgi:Tfp pilus assembly protein FimT
MKNLEIGQKVLATITKNGYFVNYYKGIVVGFTKAGRVKVSSYRGVKCHALSNIDIVI